MIELHHKIPRGQGGKDIEDNLIPLCPTCHRLEHKNIVNYKPKEVEVNPL